MEQAFEEKFARGGDGVAFLPEENGVPACVQRTVSIQLSQHAAAQGCLTGAARRHEQDPRWKRGTVAEWLKGVGKVRFPDNEVLDGLFVRLEAGIEPERWGHLTR